jgi:hypothetical protein
MWKRFWLVLFAAALGSGCTTNQVAKDQDGLRRAVLDLNTNQIMDNLIRLDKGLPIVHVDYTQLTGQVTDTIGSEGSLEQTVHQSTQLPLIILRELSNVWSGKLTASRENQVSVIGNPVTNDPTVYNAYLAFYAKPGRLMKTPEPPPPGAAILVRCAELGCDDHGCGRPGHGHEWGHHPQEVIYYWVPCEYKNDFRELSLYAVSLRGQVQSAPDYFTATIVGVQDDKEMMDGKNVQVEMNIVLDQEVPNTDGKLIATVKGRLYEKGELLVQTIPGTTAAQPLGPGRPETIVTTNRLKLMFVTGDKKGFVNANRDDAISDLAGQTVKLNLTPFSPGVPKTADLLQKINNQLELIRLGQQLQRNR